MKKQTQKQTSDAGIHRTVLQEHKDSTQSNSKGKRVQENCLCFRENLLISASPSSSRRSNISTRGRQS